MKVKLEAIQSDENSSFKILLTPKLNDLFYWHFHPEYEIHYVVAADGHYFVGDFIGEFEPGNLVITGPTSRIIE